MVVSLPMALDFERSDIGLPPGSLVYVGDRHPEEMALLMIGYDPVSSWARTAETVDELLQYRNSSGITWINVNGLKDSSAISRLAEVYKIHPLTIEDILNTEHRPKVEEFDDYLYITLKEISNPNEDALAFDQISLVLTGNTVITFQEIAGDSFDGIRRRILNNVGRVRRLGADYLAYALIDAVVDRYFIALDVLGATVEDFEERAVDDKDTAFISDLQTAKQKLHHARRAIWPLRESLSVLLRAESDFISQDLAPFLKDLQDNVIQAAETVESYREAISGIMEVHLSAASNRLNKVMKVLTIISTIFIPLTFIVGVYGMNFVHMPELSSVYGYPIVWGIMILVALGMVVFFKRRNWL
ncbi:magnesium and cobalt transport protein CorA [Treponema primitia ZAS-2]|uniref:Magnesium transport protein CorA n=2 Tax=Treponema primitia TaxID=88058 RepID=F5YLE8_TREPZ|nr:magnesium and cobalt transport protein CorA [Treponema primitia ZAS-2]